MPSGSRLNLLIALFSHITLQTMSPHVAILGGGVIGASAAYFLTLRGTRCTLIESTGIAHGASGKAGGFLAKSWQAGSATGALAEKSFELHSELAETLGGDKYGYRRVDTYSCDLGKKKKGLSPAKSVKGGPLNWFKTDKVANSRSMGAFGF